MVFTKRQSLELFCCLARQGKGRRDTKKVCLESLSYPQIICGITKCQVQYFMVRYNGL